MSAISGTVRRNGGITPTLAAMTLCGGLTVAALFISLRTPNPSLLYALGLVGFVALGSWMFLSERYERTLAVLAAYLLLLDGFLKLRTGSQLATLGRDILLY